MPSWLRTTTWALVALCGTCDARVVQRHPTAWEEPWDQPRQSQTAPEPSTLQQLTIGAIRFHQRIISPVQGPRSTFYPTSSQYTLLAIRHYGFAKGFIMGCSRLTRENHDPWVYPTITIGSSVRKQDMPY